MEQPSGPALLDVMQVIRYYTTIIFLSLAQGAVLAVIAYGFVAGAVCILIGPVFIPFLIVPNMEWLFWGWFKALIQYAFYPVIGNAFVFVYGELLLHFFSSLHFSRWASGYGIGRISSLTLSKSVIEPTSAQEASSK